MPMVPSSFTFFLPETLKAPPMRDHDLLHNHSGGGGSPSASPGLYNLSYFSNNTNSSGESGSIDNSSTMMFHSHFNNGSNNEFSDGALSSVVPLLFTPPPLHHVAATPHMSATTLLQKAVQMGFTSRNTGSTLLRTLSGDHDSLLKLRRSSINEHGRLVGGQEGFTRDFLGIHPAGSGGGETSKDRKQPPPPFKGPPFGVGGVHFK